MSREAETITSYVFPGMFHLDSRKDRGEWKLAQLTKYSEQPFVGCFKLFYVQEPSHISKYEEINIYHGIVCIFSEIISFEISMEERKTKFNNIIKNYLFQRGIEMMII